MSRVPQWAISPLDTMTHLLAPLGEESFWHRAVAGICCPRSSPASSNHPSDFTARTAS